MAEEKSAPEKDSPDALSELSKKVDRLSTIMERLNLVYYLELFRKPWKLFFVNLLAGMARGLGFVLGASLLVGLLIWILKPFISIPLLGKFIAKIIEAVKSYAGR